MKKERIMRNYKREIVIVLIAILAVSAIWFYKPAPKTNTETEIKTVTVTQPPKLVNVTKLVSDKVAEQKLEKCRNGFKDAIVRINDIHDYVANEAEPIDAENELFDADDLASIYGKCF